MNELQKYTLSSGKEIRVRRASMFTIKLATKNIPRPKPPTQVINGVEHENKAHPDHDVELEAWLEAKQAANIDAVYLAGIEEDEVFNDEAKAQVAEFRERAKRKRWNIPSDDDDWAVYVKHILLEDADDAFKVQQLILKGSYPTEGGISEAADDLKSPVEG